MRRASRAEAAGSRVTPADVVCFNLATRAETSTGSREPVIGNSFHVASSPCHSVLSHETSTDPSQETFASEKHMRDASERKAQSEQRAQQERELNAAIEQLHGRERGPPVTLERLKD